MPSFRRIASSMLFVLVAAGEMAAAQAPVPWVRLRDLDHDGWVSRAEHRSWAAEVFHRMDSSGDRQLSWEEYLSVRMGPGLRSAMSGRRRAAMAPHAQARKLGRFQAMDSDGDGIVTRAQFMAQADADFAQMDSNDDRKIGVNEFLDWHRGW
jgi:hypothetical protein